MCRAGIPSQEEEAIESALFMVQMDLASCVAQGRRVQLEVDSVLPLAHALARAIVRPRR